MAAAATALSRVVDHGSTAEDALGHVMLAPPHRPAARAILGGSLRWYLRLAPALDGLMAQGRRPQPVVHALLVAAAHQILHSRTPAESVVNIAVDATRLLNAKAASGFVNAVLRRFVRESTARLAEIDRNPATATAHPNWMVEALQAAYGPQARALLQANNEHPPMTLRVDLSRGSREDCLAALAAAGIEAAPGLVPSAVVLAGPMGVESLPGFAEQQRTMLRRAAALLAPGGRLVYATCSVLPQENAELVDRVIAEGGTGLRRLPPAQWRLPPGLEARSDGLQLLPSLRDAGPGAATDGFHYAVLTTGGGASNAT